MLNIYISVLQDTIEVSLEGKFTLPSREYTTAELKKIAREVNKALREHNISDCFDE